MMTGGSPISGNLHIACGMEGTPDESTQKLGKAVRKGTSIGFPPAFVKAERQLQFALGKNLCRPLSLA